MPWHPRTPMTWKWFADICTEQNLAVTLNRLSNAKHRIRENDIKVLPSGEILVVSMIGTPTKPKKKAKPPEETA